MTLEERDRAMRALIVIENISISTQKWIQRGYYPDDETFALIQKIEDSKIELADKSSKELLSFA